MKTMYIQSMHCDGFYLVLEYDLRNVFPRLTLTLALLKNRNHAFVKIIIFRNVTLTQQRTFGKPLNLYN